MGMEQDEFKARKGHRSGMKAALAKRRGSVDREYNDAQLLLSLLRRDSVGSIHQSVGALLRYWQTAVVDMTSCASWFVSKSARQALGLE